MGFQDWLKNLGKEGQKRAEEQAKKRAGSSNKTGGPLGEYVDDHPVLTCGTETTPASPIINVLRHTPLVDCKKPGKKEKSAGEAPKNRAPVEDRSKTPAQIDADAVRLEALREADRAIQKAKAPVAAPVTPAAPVASEPAAAPPAASEPAQTFPVREPGRIETRPATDTPLSDAGAYTPIRGRFSADIYKGATGQVGSAATPALQEVFASAVADKNYDARVARVAPVAPASAPEPERVAITTPERAPTVF